MKVKSVKSLGVQDVWNLTVDHPDHNYVLSNGLISKNSHSVAYAFITYATMWLKANHTLEFFTALMSVKSQELAPDKWQEKVGEYMSECKHFGITINPPDINHSDAGFRFKDKTIYFGFAGIKTIAKSSATAILSARKDKPFKDIWDFIDRVDKKKLNAGKFEALVAAGCFDRLGYQRKELLDNLPKIYSYYDEVADYNQRLIDMQQRDVQRARIDEIKGDKEKEETYKKQLWQEALDTESAYLTPEDVPIRKLPALKIKELPVKPEIPRHEKIILSAKEVRSQQEYIGCYLNAHPAQLIKGEFTDIKKLWKGETFSVRGIVSSLKEIRTVGGDLMAFISLEDGTETCEGTIFKKQWAKYREFLKTNMLIKAKVVVEKEKPLKVIINELLIIDGV